MSSKFVLCGLGNPGEKYRATRHNLGFRLVDFIAEKYAGKWSRARRDYHSSIITVAGADALLIKPQTYMNLSGEALSALEEDGLLVVERLLVLCDDTALPTGQIRLRRGGGDGGHNGLKSIVHHLNTETFPRLRLGCGPVPEPVDPADYVLSPFSDGETRVVEGMIRGAAKCVETWLRDGIEAAMNRFNAKSAAGPAGSTDVEHE